MREFMTMSVAASTAKTYQPGIAAFRSFCQAHGARFDSPTVEDILLFATDLARSRSAATIRVYMAAVRHHLLLNGRCLKPFGSPQLTAVIRGVERHQRTIAAVNMQANRTRPQRQPVGDTDLRTVRSYLLRTNYCEADKAMLWAAISTAYHGLLRVSEYAPGPSTTKDAPQIALRTLQRQHVRLTPGKATLALNATKTHQFGGAGDVTLHATGTVICPVTALSKYAALAAGRPPTAAFFAFADGRPLARENVNECLRLALHRSDITSHSLRIGGATTLADKGAPAWEIQAAGRWKSDAFKRYIRRSAGMPANSPAPHRQPPTGAS